MLAPWKKSYDQPRQHIKSRDVTLPTKVHLVNTTVFPVVMYECESWTIKKAERWINDVFELWCWRRLFRVPWTARRSNQSILKEISPEYSLERLMLKLKLQYFGHVMERTDWKRLWCWERLKAGGEGDDRGWDGWMASLTLWAWVWASARSRWWTGKPGMLQSKGLQRTGHNWVIKMNCYLVAYFLTHTQTYHRHTHTHTYTPGNRPSGSHQSLATKSETRLRQKSDCIMLHPVCNVFLTRA